MENFLRVDIFMVVVVILVLWSVAVAWTFKLGLYRDYERKIKNLAARIDSQNSETEKIRSLLTRVSVAFNGLLDKSKENDEKISVSLKQLKKLSVLVRGFEHRVSAVEQEISIPSEPELVQPQSKRKPVVDDVEEFSDEDHDEMVKAGQIPDYVLPPVPQSSHPQRRGNPTGRVQL